MGVVFRIWRRLMVWLLLGLCCTAANAREEAPRPAPVSVTALSTCDLAELGATQPLPNTVQFVALPTDFDAGCLVGFRGELAADRQGQLAVLPGMEMLAHPTLTIETSTQHIPGCYAAQEQENSQNKTSKILASGRVQSAAGEAGILVRDAAPSSPEALIEGTVVDWSTRDSSGPVYYRVQSGTYTLISGTGTTTTGTVGTNPTEFVVPSEEVNETTLIEVIDECTTQTTRVRGVTVGGGTTASPPIGSPGTETPDRPFIFPPVNPPFFPPEEEEEEEEDYFCTVRDGQIYTPVTREFLALEDEAYPATANHDPALGAYAAQLKSGRMLERTQDLLVKARGFNFAVERTYAGHMTTEMGGNLGHRWQLSLDQRITVLSADEEIEGLKAEPLTGNSTLSYADGYGGLREYNAISKELHQVLNFSKPKPFWAHITTYKSPPGAFHEIQRYIVVSRDDIGLRPNPDAHPFKDHPDVETEHGEVVFYVVRTPEHNQFVFNCRGQLIHNIDRFNNRMTFAYKGDINPLTHTKTLTKVVDAGGREYRFSSEGAIDCAPYATYYDGRLVANACAPVQRFAEVEDPWGRQVLFGYGAQGADLQTVERQLGAHELVSGYNYTANGGAEHLLASAYLPKQGPGRSYITNTYADGKLSTQTLGGNQYRLSYPSDKETVVVDPNGNTITYTLVDTAAGTVIARERRVGTGATPVDLTTHFEHSPAGQVTKITYPRGNHVEFAYFGPGGPVRIEQAPMQNLLDLGITYRNSLVEGRLQRITRVSHLSDDPYKTIATTFRYEPLYNSVASRVDPRGIEVNYEYTYDTPGAYGNPVEIDLPDRTLANGKQQTDLHVRYRYNRYGEQTAEIDVRGIEITRSYDTNGAVTRIEYPLDETHVFKRDERSNIIETQAPSGLVERFVYDARDLITARETRSAPRPTSTFYDYDKNFNLKTSRREVGDLYQQNEVVQVEPRRIVRYEASYDILNRVVEEATITGSQRQVRKLDYDGNGNVIEQQTPSVTNQPLVTRFVFDGADRLAEINAAGRRQLYSYDANGNLLQEQDGLAERLDYDYDGFDRLVFTRDKLETEFTIRRDPNDNVLERIAVGFTGKLDGSRKTLQRMGINYDEYNQPMRMFEDSLEGGYGEVTTEWLYDRLGDVARESTSAGLSTKIERDLLGRELQITDAVGNLAQFEYAPGGRLVKLVEAEVESALDTTDGSRRETVKTYTTSFSHDALGHVIRRQQGLVDERFYFDTDGNLRGREDALSGDAAMTYDGFGRLLTSTGLQGETRLTYTPAGLIASIKTPKGSEQRSYDVAGQLVQTTDPFGNTVRYDYDEVGNVVTVTDANGLEITNRYGPSGLLEMSTAGGQSESFRHDGLGRVVYAESGAAGSSIVQRTYDGLGQLMSDAQTFRGTTHTVTHSIASDQRSRTLQYPQVAENMQVRFDLDALGRVTTIETNEKDQIRPTYRYSGRDRFAGRYLGSYISDYEYDGDRRLVGLRVHNNGPGYGIKWEANRTFTGVLTDTTGTVYYATSSQFGATRMERHHFAYDGKRRISRVESEFASRSATGPGSLWQRQKSVKHNLFDGQGRLSEVLQSQAQTAKEGLVTEEIVSRAKEVRRDSYTFVGQTGRIKAGKTTILLTDQVLEPGQVGLGTAAIKATLGQAASLVGYQATRGVAYDNNGNIIQDEQFVYSYDFRNRLIQVDDKLATMGRKQTLHIRYDPFGRQVAQDYFFQYVSAKAFDRKQIRYLYWQGQAVAELARAPWQMPGWQLQARYIPGAMPGSTLRMDRRMDDKLTNPLAKFYLHEGLDGEIAFVTEGFAGERKDILSQPYFTGEDGWFEGSRHERFIEGSTTRMPIASRGQRYDAFTRTQRRDGGSQRTYDFAATPVLDYQRYSAENLPELIDRIEQYQPDPGFVRYLEYGVAGVAMIGAFGNLAALSELHGLLYLTVDGAVSTAVDWGVHQAFGRTPTAEGLAGSFALGALSGGLGRIATSASAIAGLPKPAEFTAGVAVDTAVGTAVEVAMTGGDLKKALATNAMSSVAGSILSWGAPKLANRVAGAFSPPLQRVARSVAGLGDPYVTPHAPPSAAPGGNFNHALAYIKTLADLGMPAAQRFMHDFNQGKLLVMPEIPSTDSYLTKVKGYVKRSQRTGRTVISFDTDASTLAITPEGNQVQKIVEGNTQAGVKGGVSISIRPITSHRIMAATLLHEFAHSLGANELQAFHISYESMIKLKVHELYPNNSRIQPAIDHMAMLSRKPSKAWRRSAMDLLSAKIKYWYTDIWRNDPARALLKTDPNGWLHELGAPPWL